MSTRYKGWQKLFLFCLGLFAGTAFCMKWMEDHFIQNGRLFSIIGLEISYHKDQVQSILAGLDEKTKTILQFHLYFDFAFMLGVYPGIAAICMMAAIKTFRPFLRKILLFLAGLQLLAWGCDIAENCYLLSWIRSPVIGNEFTLYHVLVAAKWILALGAAILAIPLAIQKKKGL